MVAGSFDAVNSREPPDGHGTAMAGAIVAHANLRGVAPAARILAIRAFTKPKHNFLSILEESRLGCCAWRAHHQHELRWSKRSGYRAEPCSGAEEGDRSDRFGRERRAQLSAPLYPAADPNVIAVTAVDAENNLLNVANRGRHIAVAAPGVDIVGPTPGGGYQMSTGTSVAAAHISGVAALLLAFKPTLTPDAIRKLLTSTATDLGPRARRAVRFGSRGCLPCACLTQSRYCQPIKTSQAGRCLGCALVMSDKRAINEPRGMPRGSLRS